MSIMPTRISFRIENGEACRAQFIAENIEERSGQRGYGRNLRIPDDDLIESLHGPDR